MVRGVRSVLASTTYTTDTSVNLKVKVESDGDVTIWVDTTQEIAYTSGVDVDYGGVALAGVSPIFDNVKVGYDNNADNDIADAGDDIVIDEDFGGTSVTPDYDDNGNLTYDGTYRYTYDAWNRLVKTTLDDTDIVIQVAEYDALGRRIKKVVTNSGDLDGTTVYYWNRWQMVEARDGSGGRGRGSGLLNASFFPIDRGEAGGRAHLDVSGRVRRPRPPDQKSGHEFRWAKKRAKKRGRE